VMPCGKKLSRQELTLYKTLLDLTVFLPPGRIESSSNGLITETGSGE
jgi:hypothetical protein